MEGSPKQVSWAEDIRKRWREDVADDLYDVMQDPANRDIADGFADYIDGLPAKFWIENRAVRPTELADRIWLDYLEAK